MQNIVEMLSLKCCGPGLTMHILCTTLLVLFPEAKRKTVTWAACGDILEENSAFETNIEGMIP